MELEAAIKFARDHRQGVLITLRADGRPQSSNIIYTVADDGSLKVSITDDRAKTKNLQRDPRCAMHINAADFWSYVVLDGEAELTPVTTDPHDATGDALVELYRAVAGEHPDWEEYRAAMVTDRRLVLTLRPQSAYGMVR
jgi:PPOX class probable F420-dependent enzyme